MPRYWRCPRRSAGCGSTDLSRHSGRLVLYSSAEPCLMCFGAVLWSGVRGLVYGAAKADVEAIGFDEGPKPADWIESLRERGVEVISGVLRDEAVRVLNTYARQNGVIYNPGDQ
ncbi:MAG: hypothetical protein U5R06_21685 [candidate division KSB1 bacterium]|nr:hypothetical protein [candidate division KSB1 bacterium]